MLCGLKSEVRFMKVQVFVMPVGVEALPGLNEF
jgi:hypothetical protein